ncbi:MAG: hypothetical protein H6712_19275 [Myxococcales bacterium]|nr:hypothetical protein [Myxococcales bacterium]MCB9716017.1 hypothetical protein [Myxococcales bacterium]
MSEATQPRASEASESGATAGQREASESGEVSESGEASESGEVSGEREASETSGSSDAEAEDDGAKGKDGGKKPGRLQQLIAEYGVIALLVFLSISAITYTGFVIAISAGFEADGSGEEAGVWLAAYIGLQATKPIRIPLVVVLTPVVASLWHRVRGNKQAATGGE